MAEIVKFVYVMIIFLSLFLVSIHINALNECTQDYDCPIEMCPFPFQPKCIMLKNLSIFSNSGICSCT
ncbi:putative Late nodulin [Medicago truncatula]|uniref:Putative Late nodulin n=1 Tax=Medicago truncatula TaxID=3880 RepID=A0A396GWL1_MEDTR|nr:putative Late nodulin [Medicago truncatula]